MILERSRRASLASAVAVALVLSGCGAPRESETGGKLTVATSTSVWGSVVQAVGGDAVEVESIVSDPGADPHSHEATPRDAATIHEADLVLYNGGGYDEFVHQILATAPDKPVVRAVPDDSDHEHGDHEHGDDEHGDHDEHEGHQHAHHEHGNEHVWYDFHTVQDTAEELARTLQRLRPGHDFPGAAQRFTTQVDDLRARVDDIAKRHHGSPVIVTEPVAHYLIQQAGLRDVTPPEFVRAVEAENDPSASAVAQIQDAVRSHRAAAVVHNPQTASPLTQRVRATAQDNGIPVVDLTETPPPGTSYVRWMGDQIRDLDHALNGA